MTQSLDAEYATVGALMLAPGLLGEVSDWLLVSDFADPYCAEVYRIIGELASRGVPSDAVHVHHELRRAGRIRKDGHPTQLIIDMLESPVTPAAVGHYGRLVLDDAVRREVTRLGERLIQLGHAEGPSVQDRLDSARAFTARLASIARRRARAGDRRPAAAPPAQTRAVTVASGVARSAR